MTAASTDGRSEVARNAGYNLAGQLVPILVALGAMPFVVRSLGPARFGLLALAWTIFGYFALMDFGLGRAVTQRVAAAAADTEGNPPIGTIARTAVLAQTCLGFVGAVALWFAAPTLASLLVPGGGVLEGEATTMLRLLAAGLPGLLAMNAQRAVLEGLSRFDLTNAVRAPFQALVFFIPLAGVWLGWSLGAIIAVLSLSRWVAAAAYAAVSPRAGVALRGSFDARELSRLARFGSWVALSNLVIPAVVYLERFILAARRGPEELAYYAAPHELMMKLLILPAALTTVLYPLFSALRVRAGSDRRIARGLGNGARIVAVFVAPIAVAVVLFAEPALTLWLGPDYGVRGGPVLRVLATAAFLNALAFVPFVLIEGVGRPDLIARYHLAELPFYGTLLWLMVGRWGIAGAALAWLLRVGWMTPAFFGLALHAASLRFRDAAQHGGVRAALAGAVALAGAHVWVFLTRDTHLFWFGSLIPIAHLASWPWLLGEEDRTWLIGAFRRAVASRTIAEEVVTST